MSPSTPCTNGSQASASGTAAPAADIDFDGRLVVAACEADGGIGFKGNLPWPRLSEDMKHFSSVTAGAAVVMGRVTYLSLPQKYRPLPGRLNVILSRNALTRAQLVGDGSEAPAANVAFANSLEAARELLEARGIRVAYVIGGEGVFEEALKLPHWSRRVYLTRVHTPFECDRFFPISRFTKAGGDGGNNEEDSNSPEFACVAVRSGLSDNGVNYSICEYARGDGDKNQTQNKNKNKSSVKDEGNGNDATTVVNAEECQYLDLVRHILSDGVKRGDRTGTGTLSVFGAQMRFSLRDGRFPLLTTKRVFWRGVAEELLWFVRGSTDAGALSAKGVKIWDANGSREFLDGRGFREREVGDLGPVYGFQWRHFGAEYRDMQTDYSGQGVDQLAQIIETLKTNPSDRRMIMSAWNPAATHLMALPPCHLLAQFYVANGELSCQMYQRSCDMGLGVPFNIASYALLTRLVAEVTGLRPGDFVHTLGDAHVYCNHIDALRTQLTRNPRPFPTLSVKHRDNIEDFTFDDLTIDGYDPYGPIAMKMAV